MKMIEFEKAKNAVLDLLVGKVSTIRAVLIVKALEDLSVDAVPVVRCKDCKHMAVTGIGFRWCKSWERIQTMGDDGFCNFGERRDNDATD